MEFQATTTLLTRCLRMEFPVIVYKTTRKSSNEPHRGGGRKEETGPSGLRAGDADKTMGTREPYPHTNNNNSSGLVSIPFSLEAHRCMI